MSYLDLVILDQLTKERDELRGKLSTIKTFVNAALATAENQQPEATLELLRQLSLLTN